MPADFRLNTRGLPKMIQEGVAHEPNFAVHISLARLPEHQAPGVEFQHGIADPRLLPQDFDLRRGEAAAEIFVIHAFFAASNYFDTSAQFTTFHQAVM